MQTENSSLKSHSEISANFSAQGLNFIQKSPNSYKKVIGDLKAKIKLLLEQRGVIVSESQIKLHKAISRKQINPVIFQA